jgi:hypothetical protein
MLLRFNSARSSKRFDATTRISNALLVLSSGGLQSQTTVPRGSIQGSVTDPSSAVVPGDKITITNKAIPPAFTSAVTGCAALGRVTLG